jgi:ParB/RepB/Spo0J family partition protein
MSEMSIRVSVDKIHPNPDNPRIEAGDVTELAASIRKQGILQELLLRPAPEFGDGHYIIEDGYRRWVAARQVLTAVPARIRIPHPKESLTVREIVTSMVTTIHRRDLNAMEKARALGRLRDEANMSQVQIAQELGIDSGTVSRYLALLELSPAYQQSLLRGTASVERALSAVKDKRARERKNKGQKPITVGWEPDHFTPNHHLAKKAKTMCDAREHSGRRRYGNVACGQCWETVIRQDQNTVDRVEFEAMGFKVPFKPPVMTVGTVGGTTTKTSGDSDEE